MRARIWPYSRIDPDLNVGPHRKALVQRKGRSGRDFDQNSGLDRRVIRGVTDQGDISRDREGHTRTDRDSFMNTHAHPKTRWMSGVIKDNPVTGHSWIRDTCHEIRSRGKGLLQVIPIGRGELAVPLGESLCRRGGSTDDGLNDVSHPLDRVRPVHRGGKILRSEEHTSELQSRQYLVC